MGLGERVELGALEIEDADAPILQQQRNRELGLCVVNHFDVTRIDRYVGDDDRLLVKRGVPDKTDAELHAREGHLVAVADCDFHLELAGLSIQQQDAEGAVIDHAARQVRDPREQLVELQDRAKFAPDLRERLERAGVLAFVLEELRVLDGNRDVRRELAQHRLVLFGELAWGVAQQVERADHASFAAQRHHELRLRSRHGLDVARIGVHVVDEQRLAAGDGRADEALTDLEAQRSDDLLRIPDCVCDRQLVALRIEQVDGECVELREARDELRDLLQ